MYDEVAVLIIYLFVVVLSFVVPAAIIIGLAVKHKKEEEQKMFFYAQMFADAEKRKSERSTEDTAFYRAAEQQLKNELQRDIHINSAGNGKGTLTVEFSSNEELAEFVKRLEGKK